MTEKLQQLLSELEQFGETNDNKTTDRSRRMLNITHDTGAFLSVLIRATNAQSVLEIGTSNGYSTLWLAEAVQAIGGSVTTVELSDYKYDLAAKNFERTDLSAVIHPIHGDAGLLLADAADHSFDLIFLDSERPEYPGWWPNLKRVIRPGGLLIVDNAISHAEQMESFMTLVASDPQFTTSLVPVGKGEFLATKSNS
ncbi:O-methyltransferase [uncultured Desulfuromusa sp.]|uniref:O-methyltransferase n=1 Tax=uncultured Desulfuromusa sp. TaxID=219183 RepID=UPI003747C303